MKVPKWLYIVVGMFTSINYILLKFYLDEKRIDHKSRMLTNSRPPGIVIFNFIIDCVSAWK